jgi:hypothetical protein
MQTVNKLGDSGKMQSPSFRKHLRRRRSLDMLNERYTSSHDNNTVIGKSATKYIPVHSIK